MTRTALRAIALLWVVFLGLITIGTTANAHERRETSGHQVVVGWAEEPAFAGFKNAVSFRVTEGGKGVEGLQMKVEVIFGDKDGSEKIGPLELEAAFGDPGHYRAPIIPTRSGKYTFHITGTLDEQPFDQIFTSSEETFHSIAEPKEVQFPEKDPSAGELGQLTTRLGSRVDATGSTAQDAIDDAAFARTLAFGAGGVALLALILGAISIAMRKRS